MPSLRFKTTEEIKVPKRIIDQVIGQEEAVNKVKKIAKQKRNLLLIGQPGTGKSLLGQALAELLPKEKLVDVLSLQNPTDDNVPLIKEVAQGNGLKIVTNAKIKSITSSKNQGIVLLFIVFIISLLPYYFWKTGAISDVIYAASLISSMVLIVGVILFFNLGKRMKLNEKAQVPKLLIDNSKRKTSPFIDGTGAHAGALLGDCLHDPLQSLASSNNITIITDTGNQLQLKNKRITIINKLLKKHKKDLIKKDNYRAVFLSKGEINLLGEKNNEAELTEVLSINKYFKKGDLIKITTESGKELIVTPEHKVAIKDFLGKIFYKEARKLTKLDEVITI